MKVCNAEQMRKMEMMAADAGISPLMLMENAARGVCKALFEFYGEELKKSSGHSAYTVALICGRGNNGGDGLALARHLTKRGISVNVLLVKGERPLSPEAGTNRKKAEKNRIPVREFSSLDKTCKKAIQDAAIVVDCLFGTGLSRDVDGVYLDTIKFLNKLDKRVVAVDMPSGINSDTGEVMGDAVRAELTIALGAPKPGHLLFPGRAYSGRLSVSDISLPGSSYNIPGLRNWLREDELKTLLKKREKNTHKGSYGHLVIIGGSPGKTGAPCLAAAAGMRSGSGLATIVCSKSLNTVFESKTMEVMTLPIDDVNGYMSQNDLVLVRGFLKDKDSIVIGPGLSTDPVTERLFILLFENLTLPAVVDADALNLLARNKKLLNKKTNNLVLTPHPGEMARLTGKNVNYIIKNPVRAAGDFASRHGVYVVLKSSTTVVASPSGNIYISTYGNPGMSTAGTGDILSGVIGSFIAQGYEVDEAVRIGVVLHGISGDMARDIKGEHGLIASDIVEMLPKILKTWEDVL